jgi:hypothetical protein
MGLFDSAEIEFPCEVCKRKIKKTIGWLKSHKEVICACGTKIILDAKQLVNATNRLEKQIAGIPKNITIKL